MAHNGLGCGHASGENSSAEGVALSHALSMPKLLQAVHPYLPEVLKKRLPLILSPAQLGHVFTIAAFLPFITCSFCALAACYFLPLDWQTVLVHFPFPVIVGGTVGHFVGAAFSLVLTGFVLPCLSVSRRTLSGGVVATPVLQDLLLRPRQDDDSDWEDFETTERVGCETTHHGSRASGKPSGETEQTESSLRRRGKRNGSPGEIGGLS
uniref:GPI biosynthesis protein family Pig-F protein, putative n=1 Tax=Neospora caninum (strain Liverpool) TaxID=572307 RepID=A0A0F7UAA5_NEOCL|nr:TPA: GPI biosynthesis protein family Pig-F protein, putative [Neospora caninum Liverpool]